MKGKKDIELASSFLKLPRIIELEILHLWKICIENKACAGRNNKCVIAAYIYLASIMHKKELSIKKIIDCFCEKDCNAIRRTAESLNTILQLGLSLPNDLSSIIIKHANKLGYPKKIIDEAIDISKGDNTILYRRKNHIVSLGILYYLNRKHNLDLSLIIICRLENVSPKSVREVCMILEEKQNG